MRKNLFSSRLACFLPKDLILDMSFFNFQNAITAAFFADKNHRIIRANSRFMEILSCKKLECQNQNLENLFQALGMDKNLLADFSHKLKSNGSAHIEEVELETPMGVRFFSLYSTETEFNGMKMLSGIQGQLVDITERVLLRKRQEKLTAQIQHDMKNQITTTLGGAQFLLGEFDVLEAGPSEPSSWETVTEMKPIVSQMHKSADFLHQMVLKMLDVSKLQNQKLELAFSRMEIKNLLEGVVSSLTPLQKQWGVEVVVKGDPVVVEIDGIQMMRVLENFHSNALKYASSKVTWSISEENGGVKMVVQDDGEGIDPMYLEKIFEPFFQVPGNEKPFSTGLGLDSARELIMMHQGFSQAESDGPGRGARFTMFLPTSQSLAVTPAFSQPPLEIL